MPGFVIKLITGKPMVLIFHLFYQGYAKSFRMALSDRLSKGFRLTGALLRDFLDYLRNYAFKTTDLIICVSNSVRGEVIRHIRTERVVVVYNGVNTKIFRKTECPKLYEAAFLGRLCNQNRAKMELLSRKSSELASRLDWRRTVETEIKIMKMFLQKLV